MKNFVCLREKKKKATVEHSEQRWTYSKVKSDMDESQSMQGFETMVKGLDFKVQ